MIEHTPGPWTNGYGFGVSGPNTPSTAGATVTDFLRRRENLEAEPNYTVVSKNKDTIAIVPGDYERRQSNAQLIAAAPDMLSVLKTIRADLDDRYDVDEESGTGKLTESPYCGAGQHLALIDAVIAKAEGRQ